MTSIRLITKLSDAAVRKCVGKQCVPLDATVLVNEPASVYTPDGSLLLRLHRRVPDELLDQSLPALRILASYKSTNRGIYQSAKRARIRLSDGTLSKNSHTVAEDGSPLAVASAIIGYFDRQGGRHPYCRQTAFLNSELKHWLELQPLIKHVDGLFRETLFDKWDAQRKFVESVRPEWVIEGTVFTTLTVNTNAVAGVHVDKGDYDKGFGVITCHRLGHYTGGILCFPRYRVGVDLQHGDVLFFNPHEWHGMTPIIGEEDKYERITCVYYARAKMNECGSPEEELERARKVRGSL